MQRDFSRRVLNRLSEKNGAPVVDFLRRSASIAEGIGHTKRVFIDQFLAGSWANQVNMLSICSAGASVFDPPPLPHPKSQMCVRDSPFSVYVVWPSTDIDTDQASVS